MAKRSHRKLGLIGKGSIAGIAATAAVGLPFWATSAGASVHATAAWIPSPLNNGVSATMNVTAGAYADDWAIGGTVGQVLWTGTQSQNWATASLEVGWARGWEGQNIQIYYWANFEARGGPSPYDDFYNEHALGNAVPAPANPHVFQIYEDGDIQKWDIVIDGVVQGRATDTPHGSLWMGCGMESSQHLVSHIGPNGAASLQYKQGSTWHNGWFASLYPGAPGYVGWITAGYYLYDGLN